MAVVASIQHTVWEWGVCVCVWGLVLYGAFPCLFLVSESQEKNREHWSLNNVHIAKKKKKSSHSKQ